MARTRLFSIVAMGTLALTATFGGTSLAAATQAAPGGAVTNVQVSHDKYVAHSEPHIAIDPTNPNIIVAGSKDFTSPQNYAFKIGWENSTDGGKTWTDHGWLPGWSAWYLVSDISFAFDRRHNVYASVLLVGGQGTGVGVNVSHDGGKTFGKGIIVHAANDNGSDKGWIAVDNSGGKYDGHAFMVWDFGGGVGVPGGLAMSRTADGGQTWTKVTTINGSSAQFCDARRDHSCADSFSPYPAVGPDGTWYTVFGNFDNKECQQTADCNVLIVSSTDGGATWSSPRRVALSQIIESPFRNVKPKVTYRNSTMPVLGISPKTGTMIVAWSDWQKTQSAPSLKSCPIVKQHYIATCDADVLYTRSTDHGATWSAPARLNDDAKGGGANQWQPTIGVSPNGNFGLSWFDTRLDPHNFLIDTYATASTTDGKTFLNDVRASTVSWNPTIDAPHPGGNPSVTFIGDYMGIAVSNTTLHPLWNDTRNGKTQELFTASIQYTH